MTGIEETMLKLDARLKGVPFDFAFLGGSVLSLLVTDPVADTIRVTKDIICLFNGRETIANEIASCEKLRDELAAKFRAYLSCPDLEDAIDGFVQTESDPGLRKEAVLKRFQAVAAL